MKLIIKDYTKPEYESTLSFHEYLSPWFLFIPQIVDP